MIELAVQLDDDPKLRAYAHPERLVSTELAGRASGRARSGRGGERRGRAALRHRAHPRRGQDRLAPRPQRPGRPATMWTASGVRRADGRKGIDRDTTVVIYGDRNNWWAAYALWVFTLFGHPDVRLLDGGRAKWLAEGRELHHRGPGAATSRTTRSSSGPTITIRAFKDDVLAHLGQPLIDVRSPAEYTGERTHMPEYPEEGALRGGHIPGAEVGAVGPRRRRGRHVQAPRRAGGDLPAGAGPRPDDDVIAYCRIGERSSHTWFVLHHLLGFDQVRNYDGSWTEWGNAVRVPIVKGAEPGRSQWLTLPPTGTADVRPKLTTPPALAEIVDDFAALADPRPAATAAGVLPGAARPAAAHRRTPGTARTGPGMPVAAVPRHRGRRRAGSGRASVLLRPGRGADHPRLRRHPARGARRAARLDQVLAVPDDLSHRLGLAEAVSPLRLNGMGGSACPDQAAGAPAVRLTLTGPRGRAEMTGPDRTGPTRMRVPWQELRLLLPGNAIVGDIGPDRAGVTSPTQEEAFKALADLYAYPDPCRRGAGSGPTWSPRWTDPPPGTTAGPGA